MENSNPNSIEKNSELLKIYLDKLQSNNLTILERNELLNLYTKKIAGDFGESKSFNDFIAQETKMEEESPIILFAKIVLNLFQNENKNISNLRDIWKLIEAGEVEIVLQYFLTIQNPDLLFCYYILIIYNIINFSENEISFNNINLVIKEIEKRVPLTQRKIFTMKYFSPKFISKLLFFLIINDISVKEIFKREKAENQFTLIKELVILTEETNEDIIKFIYKLIPLTLLITELNYKSQVLSFIAKKVYFYDDIELAKSLFLKAESNVDYEKPNSYLTILIDCDLILDNELLFALLSRMIVNVKNFRADFLKSEVYSNLLEFIYKNIINTEVKLKLLELAAPNVNLYKDSYFKFFHYLHIGKLYTRINEKELALEFLEKATKEVVSVTRVFYRVGMYSTISFFYIELNEIQKTERIEELMLIELKKYSFPYDKMLNFYKMADFYLSIQEIQKAKFYIFKIKPILRKEKKYENIEIILQSSTPLVYKLQEMEYLHFLFTYWIKKIDELEKDSELKLKVIKLLIFINEKFDSSLFDEYFPRLNLMLSRSTFIDKSLINIVRKIKDANLKNTIWISITDNINLNKYLDSSNEFLTQLFYSFLDFKDDYNAGEVINVLLKKLEITKNLSKNLETLDIIAKLSLNFPPNEKLISIIKN